jgi:membrane protein implicated in regulation of membrane protease activity
MEKEQLNELIETFKMAEDGYWLPISVVAGLFAIIVVLIIAYWKRSEDYHHSKHKENDEFKKEYMERMTNVAKLLENHEVRIDHL